MKREPVDYVPCVPTLNSLHERQRVGYRYQFPFGPSQRETCEYLVEELDVDACCRVVIPPINPEPSVSSEVRREGDVVRKVWTTPAGELSAAVRYDDKWIHGLDVPFYSDFLIGHSVKHWIETEQDVECLKHILRPPDDASAIERIRFEFTEVKQLADRLQLPIMTGIGNGLTGGLQMFGAQEICMMTVEKPEIIREYLEIEHRVSMELISLAADLGVDIVRRNGFYETSDFYSPRMLEAFIGDFLREEARAAREAGLVTTYTLNTGLMPMLDYMATLQFDCFDSIDIAFNDLDLVKLRESQGRKRSYWIGPSSVYHIWKEDPELTRAAVQKCFDVIGKAGLLITACPSSHSIMPWENTLAMIDEWKKLR